MKIREILDEDTCAGNIASVAAPLGGVLKRTPDPVKKKKVTNKARLQPVTVPKQ
jgi:hypothetical protein